MTVIKFQIKLFICVMCIAAIESKPNYNNNVCIQSKWHLKDVLKSEIDSPYQLATDFDSNTVYFSYSTHGEGDTFKIGYYDLETNKNGMVQNIAGGFASAYDSVNKKMFFGGSDGIYELSSNEGKVQEENVNKIAKHFGSKHNIWQMFIKDGDIYYSTYPDEQAFYFKDGSAIKVPELENIRALLIAVDNFDNYVFSNSSGLFVYKKDTNSIISLGDYNVNGLTANSKGVIYFSTPSGIYKIDENTLKATRIVEIDEIYGVTIDKNNHIVYSTETELIILRPTNKICKVEDNEVY